MIPLTELPTTDGVYVIHFDAPLAHARGYVGWAADIARRVAEHLDVQRCAEAGFHVASHRGSPLVCAAVRAGRSVQVAQIYPGGDRGLERRLHNKHHPRVCALCRSQRPPRPRQLPMFRRQQPAPRRGAGARPPWRLPMRPDYRFEYLVELVCSLCARPVSSTRVRTPHTRVVLFRPLRCLICGGAAVQGDVTPVRVPAPVERWAPLKRGRPSRRRQEPAA